MRKITRAGISTLIPTAEVAKALGVHVGTVSRMVAGKQLVPAYKIPGRTGAYLFDPADVEAYIASRRTEAVTAPSVGRAS